MKERTEKLPSALHNKRAVENPKSVNQTINLGYLLRRELEYDFRINGKFFSEKIYLFSLFRRRQAYFIVLDAFFKLILIILYSAFFSVSNDPQDRLGELGKFEFLIFPVNFSSGKLISSSGIFITIMVKFLADLFFWPFRFEVF